MTKYVLNSGAVRKSASKRKNFFAEIVKDLGPSPKMLITLFAVPREYWEEKFSEYQKQMNDDMPDGVEVLLEVAFPDTFEQQVKNSDIVYVHGGDDHLLKYWLTQFDLAALLQGKVYAGSSAGSSVVARHSWTCDWRQTIDGLGILPIKFIPHYASNYGADDALRGRIDWELAYNDLAAYGDKSLPIYALEEGDFVIINQ